MVSTFIKKQLKGVVILAALFSMGGLKAQLGLTWNEMGPNDIAGRSRAILFDNTDGTKKRLLAAGVSGGVFKSAYSSSVGTTWSPIYASNAPLIVSCMAQDVSDGSVYLGTGESFGKGGDGAGSSGFIGTGLYKLIIASGTYTLIQDSSLFGNINEVAVAGGKIYVAAQKGFFVSSTSSIAFTQETASGTLPALDVKVAGNGDVYYTAGMKDSSITKVFRQDLGVGAFNDKTPTNITNRGRIEIAISPVDNNYVYLSIAKKKSKGAPTGGGLSAILGSSNKGDNWTVITLGTVQFDPLFTGATGVGDYANTIVASPTKKDAFFIAGEVLYKWNQITGNPFGQGTFTQLGNPFALNSPLYLHSKIHDIKFSPTNPAIYYLATDGGIFVSDILPSGYPEIYTPYLPTNKDFNVSQFNSVAFPNFPRNTLTGTNNNIAVPYAGVIGGSIGNSLTYIPGYFPQNGVMASTSFGLTDAYQSDFSRILPKTAFYAGAYGTVLRSNDIDVAPFSNFYDQSYKGGSVGSPGGTSFANENTPFRLWENYNATDSVIFYNEITKTSFKNSNTTKTAFVNYSTRSQTSAKYDTVLVQATSSKAVPVPTQTIAIIPVYTGTAITSYNILGDANTTSTVNNIVYTNASLIDSVKYTFLVAPGDSSTINLTFKFRYDAGSVISITNKDISGNNFTTTVTVTNPIYATASATSMPIVKLPLANSARFAVGVNSKNAAESPAIFVVKRPLNFSINPDWVKIAGKNSRIDGPGGVASSTVMPVLGNTVTRLEWANNGQSIYFSTKLNDTTFYLYRISHLDFIGDSADADYGGVFTSDVDSASANTMRKKPGQRTTALGKFKYPITSLSLSNDDKTLVVTVGSYKNKTATVYSSTSDVTQLSMNNTDESNFVSKTGNLPLIPAYASLIEMTDNKVVLVGTENGIYSTSDITVGSPTWTKESGGNFPNVPVFQIRQQKYPSYKCYNAGIIYAATHGRGIWSTDKYHAGQEYAIGIEENQIKSFDENGIVVYPNPANNFATLLIQVANEASYSVKIHDISGRTLSEIKNQNLMGGENTIELNTASLNSGVYFISVESSNNFKATKKLVITK